MQENNEKLVLEKVIVNTIAFFDLFDYPLTTWEIRKFLSIKIDFIDLEQALLQSLENAQGFYFLPGRSKSINIRKKRYNYTDVKIKKALRLSRIFRLIPWVKGVAVGNIIGAHNLKQEGDIDFLIVTSKDRIWITRFLCVVLVKLFGMRPSPSKTQDKICLSFFISQENLNLENLMITGEKDFYFIYWLAGLTPIYGHEQLWQDFFKANDWIKKYLPNWQQPIFNFRRQLFEPKENNILEKRGSALNKLSKKIQLKFLSPNLRSVMNKDTRVVINNQVLKLHFNDRRSEYIDKYFKLINN